MELSPPPRGAFQTPVPLTTPKPRGTTPQAMGVLGSAGPLCPAGVGEQRSRQVASSQLMGPPLFLLASSPGVAATQPERLDAGDERCKAAVKGRPGPWR